MEKKYWLILGTWKEGSLERIRLGLVTYRYLTKMTGGNIGYPHSRILVAMG
jgi:hypothetical protein